MKSRDAADLKGVLVLRLTELVEKLLFLSRAQEQRVQLEELSVAAIVEEWQERWKTHAHRQSQERVWGLPS